MIVSTYFGSSSIQARMATRLLAGDQGGPGPTERVEDDVPALARIPDRPLDQRHRLHGRVQVVPDRLVDEPHVALVPSAAPAVIAAVLPAPEDRLVSGAAAFATALSDAGVSFS
jgi:hypothetical protein